MADLFEHQPIERIFYSEKFAWERKQFDPINQSLAQYHKAKPAWTFLQAMSGGVDGRRSLTHASLVRRYMDNCGTWRSSYRLMLALVQELRGTPLFQERDLNPGNGGVDDELKEDAILDVFFAKLSGVQEYGFHSGIETLMWSTDELNGSLASLDWAGLCIELEIKVPEWTDLIIEHATKEGEFFSHKPPMADEPESEVY
jgi:hypothetical protein